MRRLLFGFVLAAGLVATAPAPARLIAPAPIPERVAQSDVVVVGKVGKVEPKNISAAPFPGGQKVEYQVVALEVKDGLLGARGKKEIRLGFIPPQQGGGQVPIRRPGFRQLVFTQGQEGLFFLTKHPTESFCVAPAYFSFVDKNDGDFGKQVEQVKKCTKLLSDPDAGLKAKEADDRLLTACMLIARYRTPPPSAGQPKTEPVDAARSKLILLALADANWARNDEVFRFQFSPQNLFFRLGLTEKDGWKQPQDFQKLPEEARKWLKDNAGKYRIQRFVREPAAKKE